MTRHFCPFEDQVLAAVTSGDWPDRADETLRSHVAECATCADLAMVGNHVGQAEFEEDSSTGFEPRVDRHR